MLCVFDELDSLSDDFAELCAPCLSAQRLEKTFSYRFPSDRNLSAAVYLLLRLMLREYYAIDEPVIFSYGKNGKPFLCGYPQIHFSLSHCKSAVACAVSFEDTGVDVQEIIPVSDELAGRVLTAEEYRAFKKAGNPSRLFCELWVMKESFLKKTGEGIGADLTALPADAIGENMRFSGEGYCGCVAGTSKTLRRITNHELSLYTNRIQTIP